MSLFDHKNEVAPMSAYFYPEEKVKEAIKELKKKWKAKCKRMEIMSGDVAMLELFWLLEDSFGKELVEAGE